MLQNKNNGSYRFYFQLYRIKILNNISINEVNDYKVLNLFTSFMLILLSQMRVKLLILDIDKFACNAMVTKNDRNRVEYF